MAFAAGGRRERPSPASGILTGADRLFVICAVSVITDAFTKQALAYVVSESPEVDFVPETVNTLVRRHGLSLHTETIVHSDQGVHYTSYKFIQILKDTNLRQSMSRRGNCWDNAPQESFFDHMKDEIDLKGCETFEQVKTVIDDWIDYYNRERYVWDSMPTWRGISRSQSTSTVWAVTVWLPVSYASLISERETSCFRLSCFENSSCLPRLLFHFFAILKHIGLHFINRFQVVLFFRFINPFVMICFSFCS